VLVGELRAAELHLGAQPAEALLRIMFLDGGDHRADAFGHQPEINRRHLHSRQAIPVGMFEQVIDPGGGDQRLAGNAAEVQAVAPQLLFLFHEKCLGAELGGAGRHRETGRTATDDADVVIIDRHASSYTLSDPV